MDGRKRGKEGVDETSPISRLVKDGESRVRYVREVYSLTGGVSHEEGVLSRDI